MTDTIDQIAKRLNMVIADKSGLVLRLDTFDSADGPAAQPTLSNTKLLLESLANFYSDPKSDFFPTVITNVIRDRLILTENTLAGLTAEDSITEGSISGILKLLEELYAYCLQYGIITYGFTGKIAQEQIEVIQRARQQTEAAARKMLLAVTRHDSELTRKLGEFDENLSQSGAELTSKVTEKINSLQPAIDGLAATLATSQSNSTEIEIALTTAREHSVAIGNLRAEIEAAATTVSSEFATRKLTAETEVATIQALGLQVQKFESDAKAMHQAVSDARSKITDYLTQITAFYGEIETHRLQMTESGKAAQTNLAELRDSSEKLVADLRDRTEKVVDENESLIHQIKDHLRKAIGASLFTAFDTRRRSINIASWVWAALLLVSVCSTIWFAFWFVSEAESLTKNPPSGIEWILIYTRLVIVAPLAFLITFTAKRYTSERRAEEEWAFKSAISISLEPFRELIERMNKDGQETAFVERLVSEVFDNPTKRLYPIPLEKDEKEKLDILGFARDALEKIPKGN